MIVRVFISIQCMPNDRGCERKKYREATHVDGVVMNGHVASV